MRKPLVFVNPGAGPNGIAYDPGAMGPLSRA